MAQIVKSSPRPSVQLEGLYTHLPFSDAAGLAWAQERTNHFRELVEQLRRDGLEIPVTQARSSAGILAGISDGCNSVAPGSILYGKQAVPTEIHPFTDFRTVLQSIKSSLIQVSHTAAQRSGIGASRFAQQVDGPTGVIPYGRRDGNRATRPGQKSHVIVNGTFAPVLSISSEQCVLDLSKVPDPHVGDEVLIVGSDGTSTIELGNLAEWQGSGLNDVLLAHRDRLERVFVN